MDFGLLVYDDFPQYGGQNIGDYIQSLAAKQFIKNRDVIYVNRDHLNNYEGKKIKLVMNGWFSHIPENFPPNSNIIPLFVAFHLNSTIKDKFLTNQVIEYLKKFEPIGCRDKYTVSVLKEKGITAYFSGCLTLTLGKEYKTLEKNDNVYIVDPFIGLDFSFLSIIRIMKTLLLKNKFVHRLQKEMFNKVTLKTAIKSSLFINQYSKVWGHDFLTKANYIHHMFTCNSYDEYFLKADELIKKYAAAKLVITSRIHVALPCTGLETPVIFVNAANDTQLSTCRFDGLIDLFNILNHNGVELLNDGNIDLISPNINSTYKIFVSQLIKKCEAFASE